MILSMASHGVRLQNITPIIDNVIKIMYIIKQEYKLVLNIKEEDKDLIPDDIKKYETLEIYIVPENLKSHNKYYWTFLRYPDEDVITLDDDVFYTASLIKTYINGLSIHKNCIITNSAKMLLLNDTTKMIEYPEKYNQVYLPFPNKKLFAFGCNGIAYPKGAINSSDIDLNELKEYINDDDLYLKLLELRKGLKVVSISNEYLESIRSKEYYDSSITKTFQENTLDYRKKCYSEFKNLLDK